MRYWFYAVRDFRKVGPQGGKLPKSSPKRKALLKQRMREAKIAKHAVDRVWGDYGLLGRRSEPPRPLRSLYGQGKEKGDWCHLPEAVKIELLGPYRNLL